MMVESPIEIEHVAPRLHTDFDSRLPPGAIGSADEREANFLSRALAAFAIHKLAGCSLDDAAKAVVDGGGDGGIDAIHYATATRVLWIAQSKFHRNGRGEPDLGSVTKFKNGLENLLQGNFAAFDTNSAMRALVPQLELIFRDSSLQVRAVLVYSGVNLVSEDRIRLFEDLRTRFSADSDYLQTQCCGLTTVHDWLTGADRGPGVEEVELTILKPGWVKEPYETLYGLVQLDILAALHRQHGRQLISANIRAYKGDTDVNEQIASTVREEPKHFVYLNNGLTAYCERLEVNNLDRANAEQKRLRAFGFSIVNGAQTLGSIANSFIGSTGTAPRGYAFLRIISLEKCEDDRAFASRITRSTNFQNQVGLRDFVALDEQQERIANQLVLSDIHYHYKDGVDTPLSDDKNFTLEEATTACAGMVQGGDFGVRSLGNRRSLWSFDEVFPQTDLLRSRYAKIFRPDLSARTIWRVVQAQRTVLAALKSNEVGVRKDYFDNCRWLILNVIFLKLHPQQGTDLSLSPDEISAITQGAQEYAEMLWNICETKGYVSAKPGGGWEIQRHFRSVFCSLSDWNILRAALLAAISGTSSNQAVQVAALTSTTGSGNPPV